MEPFIVDVAGRGVIVASKVFSTGSRGYYGNDKVVIDGKIHTVAISLVEVGSKPAAKPAATSANGKPALK